MVQIESRRGVDNVEEIARVDGLDGVLIGWFFPLFFSIFPLLHLFILCLTYFTYTHINVNVNGQC